MICPECGSDKTRVTDSRACTDGSIRRRRECDDCKCRFTTYERISEKAIAIVKRDGTVELYDRNKLLNGIVRACTKRPVSLKQMENIVDEIESSIRSGFKSQIKSTALGEMVLDQLANVDDIAYIRFASVYKDFQSAEEFADALDKIHSRHK